jgi:DNA polymerase-1
MKTPRINSKGINTSAILGFVNTLEDVLKKEKPSHIGIAFDPPGPTFRHDAYSLYKAQREETPEVIRASVPVIKDIIRAYHIPILEIAGFEADDVIGTIAIKAAGEGFEVYMMTPDKDYGQLVRRNIYIYKPKYGSNEFEILGEKEVLAKYKLENTLQMIDLLGLMGDKSDNIPGCPGVGEITAQKLLSEYYSIENLLGKTANLKGSLKNRIEENVEQIKFSKFLATIRTDVPIEFSPLDMQRGVLDEPALRKIFDELEFRNLSSRIFGENLKTETIKAAQQQPTLFDMFDAPEVAKPEITVQTTTSDNHTPDLFSMMDERTDFDSILTVPHRYVMLENEEDIKRFVESIYLKRTVAFDTETTGINPLTAELVGVSFALTEGEACYIPVSEDCLKAKQIIELLKDVLESDKILKIGHNLKYDINVMKKYGVKVAGPIFDTMLAHYLLDPVSRHGLDSLAETHLNYRTIHIEELIGQKGKGQLNMRQLNPEQVKDYAAEDADIALRLKAIFEPQIEENNFHALFYDIELPLVHTLASMEENGVRLDTEGLRQSTEVLTKYLTKTEEETHALAGKEFNINSPKVVGEILFEHMRITDKAKRTKTGQYQTSEEVLEKLKARHPIVEKILAYRKVRKLLSTYTEALPELISPADGKLHTTYNQTVTSTGRLSSTNPNLQNIPVKDEAGKEIRKAFIPDPDCIFLSADYSQIELRVMAHLSGDENMQQAFVNEQDIHATTAARIYNVDLSSVTREMRSRAKSANFGIIYGISAFGLSEQLFISRSEAIALIEGYFRTYPGVKEYMARSIEVARSKGYAETLMHRRHYLPDINSRNAVVRGYAERNAINSPVQGTAADIIKVAMNIIFRRFEEENFRSKMIMQVHDELNFNVIPEELESVRRIVVNAMENAVTLSVPLVADCGTGKNWLEAH